MSVSKVVSADTLLAALSEVMRREQLVGTEGFGPILPDGYDGTCGESRDRDTGALVGAVCRLLASREERTAMGAAARRRVEEHFSVAGMVDAYLRIYGEVSGQDVSRFVQAARPAP